MLALAARHFQQITFSLWRGEHEPWLALKRRRRSTAAGVKIDTGVGLKDGFRYRRVRAAVKAGRLRPSVRAIKLAEGGSDETVRGYLAQLEREGLIERSGRGWQLGSLMK